MGQFKRQLYFCVILATVSLFGGWWFQPGHIEDPVLFTLLSVAIWFFILRYTIYGALTINIRTLAEKPALENLKVDVLTTASHGEPISLIQESLLALKRIRYPHETWLLDDSGNPALETFCTAEGVRYVARTEHTDYKCGNINHALPLLQGDYVLVIDPDHIVYPEFLDQVLGYFEDPQVGFVQTTQAYYNQDTGFVATAGAEQTYLFYGPFLRAFYHFNANFVIGTNCTFRRSALDSIHGYQAGLAEDLHTSMALHHKGWKSVYVPKILARGLTPADLESFLYQQLKWSRGVLDLLFHKLPRYYGSLTGQQRFCYLLSMSYYFESLMIFIWLALPLVYFSCDIRPFKNVYAEPVLYSFPMFLAGGSYFFYIQRWLCDSNERGYMLSATLMRYLDFPIHMAGILFTLVGQDVFWAPTGKGINSHFPYRVLIPHFMFIALTIVLLLFHLWDPLNIYKPIDWTMVAFGLISLFLVGGAILFCFISDRKLKASSLKNSTDSF